MKNNRFLKRLTGDYLTYALLLVVFAAVQIWQSSGQMSSLFKGLLVPMCIYSIMAVSLNLTAGIMGELSLGHAGFMCIGAFTGAIFTNLTKNSMTAELPRFILALLLGAAVAAVFGFLIGIPVLRLKGDYLAIVTLAFGEIIKNIMQVIYIGVDSKGIHVAMNSASNLKMEAGGKQLMKGALGINGTPKQSTFAIAFICLLITLIIVLNLMHSRSGRAVMAIRDNRIAAESVGIDVTKYKMLAFVVSASLAGVAGVLYSHNISSLQSQAQNFGYNMSIMVLVYVVLGGLGNMRGSIIAACILTALPELLRGFNNYRMLIYAIVLIVLMIFNWAPAVLEWREKTAARFRRKSVKEVQ